MLWRLCKRLMLACTVQAVMLEFMTGGPRACCCLLRLLLCCAARQQHGVEVSAPIQALPVVAARMLSHMLRWQGALLQCLGCMVQRSFARHLLWLVTSDCTDGSARALSARRAAAMSEAGCVAVAFGVHAARDTLVGGSACSSSCCTAACS